MISSVLPTYSRAPLQFVKGEGPWLTEADGRRFLDMGAGIAVNVLGHAHPALVKALTDQAQNLWHVSNLYNIPQQQALADNWSQRPLPIRFFSPTRGPRPANWR
jgi:acetylornithine/N-succinyldiaminopimelate aminotransferase